MGNQITGLGEKLAKMTRMRVAVGVLGAKALAKHEGSEDDEETGTQAPTVLDVAIWNHWGTEHIPARPFIALALETKKVAIRSIMTRIATGVLQDKLTIEDGLALLGTEVAASVQEQIADGVPPPNAERTIDAKGSSTPLINTGQLRQSISYDVREKA